MEKNLKEDNYIFVSKTKSDTNLPLLIEKKKGIRPGDSAVTIDKDLKERIRIQAEINFSGGCPNPYSCFYSSRVDQIMKGKEPHDLDSASRWKIMNQLNTKELLYFCTTYPASYSQICSRFKPEDETTVHKYLPYAGEGYVMDVQQTTALRKKRKEVLEYLSYCMKKNNFSYDANDFRILDELNGWELIPILLTAKDDYTKRYVITLIFHFMKNDDYTSISKNPAYAKMYSGNQETTYPYSKELFDLVKEQAIRYYNSKTKN